MPKCCVQVTSSFSQTINKVTTFGKMNKIALQFFHFLWKQTLSCPSFSKIMAHTGSGWCCVGRRFNCQSEPLWMSTSVPPLMKTLNSSGFSAMMHVLFVWVRAWLISWSSKPPGPWPLWAKGIAALQSPALATNYSLIGSGTQPLQCHGTLKR